MTREILVLPPHALWEPWEDPPNPAVPDREEKFRILARSGYRYRRIDLFGWPWNPWARSHSILRAIDPLRALRVLLFHRRADVVVSSFESGVLIILLLRRALRFQGKIIVSDVGMPGTSRLRDVILRLVLRRVDLVQPLGTPQVAGLIALGARPSAVRPLFMAIEPAFYADAGDRPGGYILAIGDDVSRDYPTLLRAAAGLDRRVVIRSRVVAGNPETHPNVEVLANGLPNVAYRTLIADALLVVLPLHPSVHAGGVTSLLEVMASGKPVIVSASEGIADYTRSGINCRVVPCEDSDALRCAMDALIGDAAERTRLGTNARRFVLENCSEEAAARQFVEAFDFVLGKSEAGTLLESEPPPDIGTQARGRSDNPDTA